MRRSLGSAGFCLATLVLLGACGGGGQAKEVGEIQNDWMGNEIKVEALHDPKVPGVTCHLAHFERGVLDRLSKGNWFEDPSNSAIACRQTGPITLGDVARDKNGEEVFDMKQSLFFKTMVVRRVFDAENNTLIYVVYSRKPIDGSAKMSVSTVSLYQPSALTSPVPAQQIP